MKVSSIKVNSRYQISIPKWARQHLSIKSGDHLLVDIQDGMMMLLPMHGGYTRSLKELHREVWKDSNQYILRERKAWISSDNPQG